MPALIAFFTALPALIQLLSDTARVITKLSNLAEKNNFRGWINDLEKSIDLLNEAKSGKEKLDAAKKLVDIINNTGA